MLKKFFTFTKTNILVKSNFLKMGSYFSKPKDIIFFNIPSSDSYLDLDKIYLYMEHDSLNRSLIKNVKIFIYREQVYYIEDFSKEDSNNATFDDKYVELAKLNTSIIPIEKKYTNKKVEIRVYLNSQKYSIGKAKLYATFVKPEDENV